MSSLRVLHVIGTLGHGGAEHQLVMACRALQALGIENVVCYFREPAPLCADLEACDIPVARLDLPEWPASALGVRRLVREIRKRQPDVVHTSLLPADVVGGIAGRLTNTAVVGTLCAIAGPEMALDNPYQPRWKVGLETTLWGHSLRRTHRHIIAISNAVRESAIKEFGLPPDRLTVVYRGVDESMLPNRCDRFEIRNRMRRELEVGPEAPLFLSVGRLVPVKGHRYLLEALPSVVARFPATKLLLVGGGWLESDLRRLANGLGVSKNVEFLGRRRDVHSLMCAADIFVFPSLWEGLGVALLEAASMGMPCITSNVAPMTEIIGHERSGLCVPIRSSHALSEAMHRLLADPVARRSYGTRARDDVLERFDIAAMARELRAVYERVVR